MIDPKQVIQTLSVDELCSTAENYYRAIADPTPQMGKPFTSALEAPELLMNMGVLLSGLCLGKTMTVLDFGSGTGWFSRFLNQLQCSTISCDTSRTALEIGKRLFREYPIIGSYVSEPQFLHFDGHRIELPDHSVDRIICFDAFHHIPNQEEVLAEFARVLKEGGIAGFSEPGPRHSQTPQAQYEMANYRVLENDIDVNQIFSIARRAGFTEFTCQLICHKSLSLAEYNSITHASRGIRLAGGILNNISQVMRDRTIFFLHKGTYQPDSRSSTGLAYSMSTDQRQISIRLMEEIRISFKITNSGTARWLHRNVDNIGVVKLGAHLYDSDGRLTNLDFLRSGFDRDILPGETFTNVATLALEKPGRYKLAFDLVSESVCWFENIGSKPIYLDIIVH